MSISAERLQAVFGRGVDTSTPEAAARSSAERFVIGRTQLSLVEAGRNPQGHVITAFEALEEFGVDLLEEAVEFGSAVIASHPNVIASSLKKRRVALGLDIHQLAKRLQIAPETLKEIEANDYSEVPLQEMQRIAFALGLDERRIAFRPDLTVDAVAARLKTLGVIGAKPGGLNANAVLSMAEAASIIRVQYQLQDWLGVQSDASHFSPNRNYGSSLNPAWNVGYVLADAAREELGLGLSVIRSMRELVEEHLGIPVVQAEMSQRIAGATISVSVGDGKKRRGVILNTVGHNENPWVRRATLAHELGHLLYDPEQELEAVRVDSYQSVEADPHDGDYVEQRANAFAIALLAPVGEVRRQTGGRITWDEVGRIASHYGISVTAAGYHVENANFRTEMLPAGTVHETPSDEWFAAENFALDYFPVPDIPPMRRGRFLGLVLNAWKAGLISGATAAAYSGCSEETLLENLGPLRNLYGVD